MEAILAGLTVSMSELKRNPTAVMKKANHRPVAVLDHNRLAFYMLEPRLLEVLLDEIADQDLYRKAIGRLSEKKRAVEIHIDDLQGRA